MFEFPDDFAWLFPWRPLDSDYVAMSFNIDDDSMGPPGPPEQVLIEELHREMVQGHKLFGETVRAVAVYTLTHKDFVFTSANPAKPISCVHLTWSTETDPTWPMTNIYSSLDAWVKQMTLEHNKYKHLQPKYDKPRKQSDER